MSKKEPDALKIPQRLLTAFNEEYEKFCKWSKNNMTRTEFLEFAILQAKHKRANHRALWQFYSISPKKIGILDRQNKEKIVVSRLHDYLFCENDNDLFCGHCVYCLIDKDVKKSLNKKYIWYLTRAFKPPVKWPKFIGQKLDFVKIIGDKKPSDGFVTSDLESIDLRQQLEDWKND